MRLDFLVFVIILASLFYVNRFVSVESSPWISDYSRFDVVNLGAPNVSVSVPVPNITQERKQEHVPFHTIFSSNHPEHILQSTGSRPIQQNVLNITTEKESVPSVSPPTSNPTVFSVVFREESNYTLPRFGIGAKNEYDYAYTEYPIPFEQLYHNKSMRYVQFDEINPLFPSCVEFGEVGATSFIDVDYIAVTGSSTNHLYSNINTIYSILRADIRVSIVFVDFGLDQAALTVLIREMSRMDVLYKSRGSRGKLYYRKFDFSHFPVWFDINDKSQRGGYSWKVISYYDVLMESRRIVFWSDGGNQLALSIEVELNRTRTFGLFTPYSSGSLHKWTYPLSIEYLRDYKMLRRVLSGKGMCTGGYLFVNFNNAMVMSNVMYPLMQCAYTRRCIAPQGSSRKNHRQDQSILSALVNSAGIGESCRKMYNTQVRFHQECHSDESCANDREALVRDIVGSL